MDTNAMRVADSDRDTAIGLLRDALVAGRISLSEFEERSTQANSAKTYGDIELLFTDLPVAPDQLPTPPTFKATSAHTPTTTTVRTRPVPPRRAPARTVPMDVQRRRSAAASVVALLAIFTGATVMATMPLDEVYAEGYTYAPSAITRDEFGAAVISEKLMLSSGDEYGYEVLRHTGSAGVLTIKARYANDAIRVKYDINGEEPGGVRVATYTGVADVVLPEGSIPVEVSATGSWSYTFTPSGQ